MRTCCPDHASAPSSAMSFSDSTVSRRTRPRSSLELKSPRILARDMPRDHRYFGLTKSTLRLRAGGRPLLFGVCRWTAAYALVCPRSPTMPAREGGHFPCCRFLPFIRRRDCDSNVVESAKNPPADRLPVVLPGTKEPRATGVKLRFDPTAGIPWFPWLRMPRIVLRLRSCLSGGHHCPRRVEFELSTSKVRA